MCVAVVTYYIARIYMLRPHTRALSFFLSFSLPALSYAIRLLHMPSGAGF